MLFPETVTVDFDHTITKKCLLCASNHDYGGIQEGAVEALKKLQEKYRIIIYSGRFREVDRELIEDFLKKHEVPYDEIVLEKPIARFMIDDRGLHHKTWDETLKEIKEREDGNIDYLCGVKDEL